MSRVLAVDPGVKSGLAYWSHDGVTWTEETGQMEACDLVEESLSQCLVDVVVCEAYRITQDTVRKTQQTASLEIIGAVRFMCWKFDVPFVLQTAADAKRFMTDLRLKQLSWYTRTDGGHTNDALRHLGLYLAKHEGNEEVLRASGAR